MKRFLLSLFTLLVVIPPGFAVFLNMPITQAAPQVIPQDELAVLVGGCTCEERACSNDSGNCAWSVSAGSGAQGCNGCGQVYSSTLGTGWFCIRDNGGIDMFGCCEDDPIPCFRDDCEVPCRERLFTSTVNCSHSGDGELCGQTSCNYQVGL